MTTVATQRKERRLTELDAIRGLAALSVFWGHAFGMMAVYPKVLVAIQNSPLHFFYDGAAAVMLFFVLSGFVLNLRYTEIRDYPRAWAGSFIIRRVFRIYPAFFATLGIALLLRATFYRPDLMAGLSAWFSGFWAMPISWAQCLKCLTLIGPNLNFQPVDPPIWSLVFEMRISLFFPLIILIVNRPRKQVWDVLLVVATYALCFVLANFARSFQYLPHFLLGAVCAKHFKALQPRLSRFALWGKVGFLAAVFLLYEAGAIAGPFTRSWRIDYVITQLIGLGSAGLILSGASFLRLRGLLNTPVCRFLGRTSYSFYLIHLPLLMAFGPLLLRASGSFGFTWLVSLAAAYLVSELLFRFVEAPWISAGSRVSRAFCELWSRERPRTSQDIARLKSNG